MKSNKLSYRSKLLGKGVIISIMCMVGLCGCGTGFERYQQPGDVQHVELKEQISRMFKGSDTFELREVRGKCGYINIKNGFIGQSGFKRFISIDQEIKVEGESANFDQEKFNKEWDTHCSTGR